MPIYEFYCEDCHTIFNFLSRRIDTETRPDCPRCGRPELERQLSLFAISKNRPEKGEGEGDDEDALPDVDEAKLMEAVDSLSREAENLNEDDPRQMAQMLRKLYGATGLPMGPGMEEAMSRLEAGEDPEAIEEELGDALGDEAELFGEGGVKKELKRVQRRMRPRTDSTLYELHPSGASRPEA